MLKVLSLIGLGLSLSVTSFGGSPNFKKVVVVIFENSSYQTALSQPFFAKVAKEGAIFSQFIAEAHPSQANYIAMVAGDTLGVRGDANVNLSASHLGDLLDKKGLSWKLYAEDLPSPCFTGASSGKYARKHVPLISFTQVQNNPVECAKIVNANDFTNDYSANALPTVSFYIPNLSNDGHDTGAKFASEWFSTRFGSILADSKLMKDTLFVVTFDESDNYLGPNQIYTVLLGANVIPGSNVTSLTTHYSVLRTLEDQFGLGTLGKKDQTASAISGIWQ